jgi:3'5'-cyclic nucleotide phosphodiesterase
MMLITRVFRMRRYVISENYRLLHFLTIEQEMSIKKATRKGRISLTSFVLVYFQLIKEKPHIGVLYNNQSVAEQNSVELAWELLMEPTYEELQKCIYSSDAELRRFRQLVVNVVMATDIFDKDMTAIRNNRWKKAFHRDEEAAPLTQEEDANLKATIVLEHLLQASDVSHTMQHWQ